MQNGSSPERARRGKVCNYFLLLPVSRPMISRESLLRSGARQVYLTGTIWLFAAIFIFGAAPNTAAEPVARPWAAPFPAVAAFATERNLPLSGVAVESDASPSRVGDEVIVLITSFSGKTPQQWLANFRLVEPSAADHDAKTTELVLHSSTGAKHIFASTIATIELRLFGPFPSGAKVGAGGSPREQKARMQVKSDYLALGLDRWFADVLNRRGTRFLPNDYSSSPFTAEQIATTVAIAREVGFTPAADRAAAGGLLALGEFFSVAQKTPGLADIMQEVVDRPSLWSIATRLGVAVRFYWAARKDIVTLPEGPVLEGWPSLPIYRGAYRLDLNGALAANVDFLVTSPLPPLQTCAGVIGISAESPSRPNRRVELRVLGARRTALAVAR